MFNKINNLQISNQSNWQFLEVPLYRYLNHHSVKRSKLLYGKF